VAEAHSDRCPKCGTPVPEHALSFLRDYSALSATLRCPEPNCDCSFGWTAAGGVDGMLYDPKQEEPDAHP